MKDLTYYYQVRLNSLENVIDTHREHSHRYILLIYSQFCLICVKKRKISIQKHYCVYLCVLELDLNFIDDAKLKFMDIQICFHDFSSATNDTEWRIGDDDFRLLTSEHCGKIYDAFNWSFELKQRNRFT